MYDWDEITGNSSNSIGYVNFVDEKHEFVSTHYIVNGIPVVKVSLSKSADDTLEWLYEYLYKLYKEPLYSSESEVQAQYGKLFTDIDKSETPLKYWRRNLTDSVKIITNLYPHQYSAKLVSFALSIVFQIIDYFLFYLKVIIINTYTGSSCKVFFDSPNDDTRFTPFSIAIFVFPTHWCHSDSDGFSNNLSRSENRAERNIVTLLAEYRE